jgi:hypothetical protein
MPRRQGYRIKITGDLARKIHSGNFSGFVRVRRFKIENIPEQQTQPHFGDAVLQALSPHGIRASQVSSVYTDQYGRRENVQILIPKEAARQFLKAADQGKLSDVPHRRETTSKPAPYIWLVSAHTP